MMKALALCLALVSLTHAKNSYVVIAPSKVRANMDLSLPVNILAAGGPVSVTAGLSSGSSEVATASGSFTAGTPGTLSMKLPASLPGSSYTLKVTGSGGLNFTNSRRLNVNKKQMSIFIQTDKGMYKPRDKVNFRVFAIYPDLSAINAPMDVFIYDGQGNKIKQWLQEPPVSGVVTKSISLSSQPVLGDWKVQVKLQGETVEKVFELAEYVLPKFDVQVEMPSYVVSSDSDITLTVKSKYTYGKPVKGNVELTAKLHYSYETYDTARDAPVFNTKLAFDGETKVTIPMANLLKLSSNLNSRKLSVVANVTETLTGNTMTGNGSVTLYDKGYKVEFPKTNPETFKPALKYTAYLKVSQQDGLPVSGSTFRVLVDTSVTVQDATNTTTHSWWQPIPEHITKLPIVDISVPDNGLVAVPVDIPADAYKVLITANYRGVQTQLTLKKSYSPSKSYIQLFLRSTGAIMAGNQINFEVKATQPVDDLVYQVLSRGAIVSTGSVSGKAQQTIPFSVTSSAAMAPNARIVVYYVRADGEIVTDSISFDIEGAFKNKVTVSVNQSDAEPGEKVRVTVTADPMSHAHILAIDQSVLLLRSGNDVTADDVYSELKAYDTIDSKDDNIGQGFGGGFGGPGIVARRQKRMIWWPYPVYYGGSDATKIFQNAGVVVLTDALVYQHQEPIRRPHPWMRRGGPRIAFMARGNMPMARGMPMRQMGVSRLSARMGRITPKQKKSKPLAEVTRVRVDFSESWLWQDQIISANGTASIETAVPDTITSWVASAFAINDQSGLGVAANQAHLKVFRPFFVSLNLPYSVTRGEQLALQAIVFNYMQDAQQVRVTLAKSDNFFNIFVDANGMEGTRQVDAVQDILVAAGEAKSVYFPIIPADLGRINIEVKAQSTRAADAVRRQLLVEAEGVSKEYNVPVLVELTGGKTSMNKTVDLTLPPNVVAGSELMRVSAVGDLMGPSVAGLDSLLKMPTGCGEQTMLGLAPDVYVTDYLTSVNQLTGDIADKALGYMESGYQRELTYKHLDHSFSAFGDRDDSGSMWLTAFVSRVFHQAKSHIFVDDQVIVRAVNWMVDRQAVNGSFPEPGRVIHKNMQGKAGSGTALSLFVFISMMENKDLFTTGTYASKFSASQTKALAYLESQMTSETDVYTLAMASYAFQLAGSAQTQTVLGRLESMATVKDGLKFWQYPVTPAPTAKATWRRPHTATAVNTEMTSYVLLTYAAQKDLVKGKNIMQWVAQQRNPNGGFSSTQDTVVALNALSEFSRLVYSDTFNVQVSAKINATVTWPFTVDRTNSLVLQSKETKIIPTQVQIEATGSGVALAEVAVFFNVESEVEETTFDLTVTLVEETLNQLTIETCTRWLGEGPASGMAVAEVGIPSGFEADPESISQHALLKRVEHENKKVVLYFDEINTTMLCMTMTAVRTGLVAKSQPAAVRVFDYYEPGNQVTAFYQSQVLKNSNVCDVCVDCDNCINRRK